MPTVKSCSIVWYVQPWPHDPRHNFFYIVHKSPTMRRDSKSPVRLFDLYFLTVMCLLSHWQPILLEFGNVKCWTATYEPVTQRSQHIVSVTVSEEHDLLMASAAAEGSEIRLLVSCWSKAGVPWWWSARHCPSLDVWTLTEGATSWCYLERWFSFSSQCLLYPK